MPNGRALRAAGLLLALVSLCATLHAVPDPGTRFNDLGHHLMCTCGCGQVLMECNHVGCQSSDHMRGELLAAMNRGDDDNQIMNWFVQQYGPVVLAAPTKSGFNRVAWLVPYVTLVLGLALTGYVVSRLARKYSAAQAVASGAGAVVNDEVAVLRQRVREETDI